MAADAVEFGACAHSPADSAKSSTMGHSGLGVAMTALGEAVQGPTHQSGNVLDGRREILPENAAAPFRRSTSCLGGAVPEVHVWFYLSRSLAWRVRLCVLAGATPDEEGDLCSPPWDIIGATNEASGLSGQVLGIRRVGPGLRAEVILAEAGTPAVVICSGSP